MFVLDFGTKLMINTVNTQQPSANGGIKNLCIFNYITVHCTVFYILFILKKLFLINAINL